MEHKCKNLVHEKNLKLIFFSACSYLSLTQLFYLLASHLPTHTTDLREPLFPPLRVYCVFLGKARLTSSCVPLALQFPMLVFNFRVQLLKHK